jgi:hypothetical protein
MFPKVALYDRCQSDRPRGDELKVVIAIKLDVPLFYS